MHVIACTYTFIHVHVHLSFHLFIPQIDDEPFNPDYTVADRILDLASQVESSGEVSNVHVHVHVH